ncbi:amino acid permease [Desulfosediminicola sp.]|uniref:amino acid permease n=1 Tax=Desulfosediminicola sp. TaxID=2886825 RepID=UPI003AF26D9F
MQPKNALPEQTGVLGTFAGVFTPSILTILGIILFLRLGYVVGSTGLMYGLLIIGLANSISVLTTFSLAAIATNFKVKGGGDYYLISRTLGLEFGGALGFVLFLAQSVSIAFYCIGFGEVVAGYFPGGPSSLPQMISALAVALLFLLAWVGADLATKFQYLVMAFLVLALTSFYIGGVANWDSGLLAKNLARPQNAAPFWVLFAIFFPAVTGFTQGVSMSGDLKYPEKSLPLGTFVAVGLSIVVYVTIAILFAASRPLTILQNDYGAMADIAYMGIFIDAGVIAATLSSAMASFLGAPRILQSLAKDKIFLFLNPFAKGSAETDNPQRGVALSAAIAFATIALGELDLIARLVSMFFLISYGLLNYATYYEAGASSPSFRPRFKWYHKNISLAGAAACLGVMLAIDWEYGIAAIAILFAIYQYLRRTTRPARWADSQRSHNLQKVRSLLLEAGSDPDHPRDWRPYILAFSATRERRGRLLEFASWLEGKSGLTTVVQFIEGEGAQSRKRRLEAAAELKREVESHRLDIFSRVIASPDALLSLDVLIQSFGLGPIKANTILLNWLEDKDDTSVARTRNYVKYLRSGYRAGCHLVIFKGDQRSWDEVELVEPEKRRIDVWWRGDATSRLMLLLAYLTTRDKRWDGATIRVLATNYSDLSEKSLADLQQTIGETRINAEMILVENADHHSISKYSADAELTFMGVTIRSEGVFDIFGDNVQNIEHTNGLLALVQAGQEVDLGAEPEEGEAGDLAEAQDNLDRLRQRLKKAEKAAADAAAKARTEMDKIELGGSTLDQDLVNQLRLALQAREKSELADKRMAREQAKVDLAIKEAEGGTSEPKDDEAENTEHDNPEDGGGVDRQ